MKDLDPYEGHRLIGVSPYVLKECGGTLDRPLEMFTNLLDGVGESNYHTHILNCHRINPLKHQRGLYSTGKDAQQKDEYLIGLRGWRSCIINLLEFYGRVNRAARRHITLTRKKKKGRHIGRIPW